MYTVEGPRLLWSVDGNIPYLGLQHSLLFVVATAAFLFLWLPYTLVTLLGKHLNSINCQLITRNLLRLKPFLDTNYSTLHHRHQYWFGVLLLVIAAVLLSSATAPDNSLVFSIAFASVLLTFWGKFVYESGHVSLLHSFLFTNLAVLNAVR